MATTNIAETSELKVAARPEAGKGVARKLRRSGMIPGVFYGSRSQPIQLELKPEDLVAALDTPKFKNTMIRLNSESPDLNGRAVMVKEIQRHPLSRALMHVDLMEVYSDMLVRASVPVHITGHPVGVDLGGTLEQHMRSIHIRCTAEKIPAFIQIDATPLDIGGHVKLKEVPFAEGVEILDDLANSVVSVVAPRVLEEVKPEGEEAEAAEAAAAAEGKPGEAKAGDAKGKAGEAKAGDAKGGEAKAGDAKAGKGGDKGSGKSDKGK